MEKQALSKHTVSFGLSLSLCSVVNALLVIVKGKSPAVRATMKHLTGHHWVTHAAIILILFILFGLGFTKANGGRGFTMPADLLIKMVLAGVIAGGLIINGFYLFAG